MDVGQLLQNLKDSPVAILLGLFVILLSSLITISSGLSLLRRFYRSTLGYKGVQRRKLSRLSAGVNIGWFKEILGMPVFLNSKSTREAPSASIEDVCREYIFVNKYFYVQAIADSADSVLAFSVTTRSKRFNPSVTLGPYSTDNRRARVRLGKTKFDELTSFARPSSISSSLGARRFHYYEEYYFGNPANYQTYVFAVNDAGCEPWKRWQRWDAWDHPKISDGWTLIDDLEVAAFRRRAAINTYTVTAPLILLEKVNAFGFGPNYDQVRIVDRHKPMKWRERRRIRKVINMGPSEWMKRWQTGHKSPT